MRDNKHVEFEERKKKNEEILEIDGICFGMEMKIILVYFDVRRNEEGRNNNDKIRKDIESMIKKQQKGRTTNTGGF